MGDTYMIHGIKYIEIQPVEVQDDEMGTYDTIDVYLYRKDGQELRLHLFGVGQEAIEINLLEQQYKEVK